MSAEPEPVDTAPLLVEMAQALQPVAQDLQPVTPDGFTALLGDSDVLKILKAIYPYAIPANVDGAFMLTTDPGSLHEEIAEGSEVVVLAEDALQDICVDADEYEGCISYGGIAYGLAGEE